MSGWPGGAIIDQASEDMMKDFAVTRSGRAPGSDSSVAKLLINVEAGLIDMEILASSDLKIVVDEGPD